MPDSKAPPNAEQYGYRVIGWCKEAIEEGDNFLHSQKGFNRIDDAINAVMGDQTDFRSSMLSSTTVNEVGKSFLDLAAGMTDVKPFWEYRTYNKRFEASAALYGKLSTHYWLQKKMDMEFLFCTQYAECAGSSYFEPYWNTSTEDFSVSAWDPRDVLPIRPTNSPSIQDCYGVITRRAMTVNEARYLATYVYHRPDLASQVAPDRDGSIVSYSLRNTRVGQLMERMGNPFRERLFGEKAKRDIPRIPSVDMFTAYIDDDTRNESGRSIHMGNWVDTPTGPKPLNNWSYVVEPGDQLYPRKRMITFCNGLSEPLYDGPSIWWHGLFPYPKLTLDPIPWSYLGKAPLWDLLPLQKALNKLLRVYDDYCEQLARPGAIADKNSVSQQMFNKLDTRKAGFKIRQNPVAGKGIQIVPPPNLPNDFWHGIEYYTTKIRELSGQGDLSNMMQLNQLPSANSIEKIQESMSLSWRLRSRSIEVFMREFATMMAYNFAQFETLPRRIAMLGADGVTQEDFDFDPGSLVPDFVDSSDFGADGNPTRNALQRGPLPRIDRAQNFLRQFSFHIAPGSLLAASEIERKLLYLQLSRAQLVDIWTLLEVLGIPNVGTPPTGSIPERLQMQMEMGIGMAVNPAGRKATGQSMPKMSTKDGGSRSTISESG